MRLRTRHKVVFACLRPAQHVLCRIKYGFRAKVYKGIKPPYIILSNHISLLDPLMVSLSFRHPVYFVASDFLFSNTLPSKAVQYLVSPISITKGNADVNTVRQIVSVVKQGGAVGLFPSGNTSYSGKEAYIVPSTYKLIKMLKVPVILYRTDGLYGADPRWGRSTRKGKSVGQVQAVLSAQVVADMSVEQLQDRVVSTLQSPDQLLAISQYKSAHHAEYLERALFWCPQCNSLESLHSHKDTISCRSCGYSAVYNSDLTLTVNGQGKQYRRISEWFYDQLEYVKQLDFSEWDTNTPIFGDEQDNIYYKPKGQTKQLIHDKVSTTMYVDRLVVGSVTLPISDIVSIAMQNRGRILVYTKDSTYMIMGQNRTNHYKYIVMHRHLLNKQLGEDNYELLGL